MEGAAPQAADPSSIRKKQTKNVLFALHCPQILPKTMLVAVAPMGKAIKSQINLRQQ
jgi:hypothetical protein